MDKLFAYAFCGPSVQRVTITLDDDLMVALDRFMAARNHGNRSEAIRDLVRSGLQDTASENGRDSEAVAALVYVYDHETRRLPERLTTAQHDHHHLCVSTLHVHLDHASCMEVAVLKGASKKIESFANSLIAERGVRYGKLVSVPAVQQRGRSHGH